MGICASSETLHDTGATGADVGGGVHAGGDAAAAVLGHNSLTSKVDLYITCNNLKNADVVGKSDPFCVVCMNRLQKSGQYSWEEVGRTEIIMNRIACRRISGVLNAIWTTPGTLLIFV